MSKTKMKSLKKYKQSVEKYGYGGKIGTGVLTGASAGLGIGTALAPVTAGASVPIGIAAGAIIGGTAGYFDAKDEADTLAKEEELKKQNMANVPQQGNLQYGSYNPYMKEGGSVPTDKVPINVEHNELEVSKGKVVRDFKSKPPHPQTGINPQGNIIAEEGNIIIPKDRRQEYLSAGRFKRNTIEHELRNVKPEIVEGTPKAGGGMPVRKPTAYEIQQQRDIQSNYGNVDDGNTLASIERTPKNILTTFANTNIEPVVNTGSAKEFPNSINLSAKYSPSTQEFVDNSATPSNISSINGGTPIDGKTNTRSVDGNATTQPWSYTEDNSNAANTASFKGDPNDYTAPNYGKALATATPFIDNLVNGVLTTQTPKIPTPEFNKPITLNKNIEVRPQLTDIERARKNALGEIANNTSSGAQLRSNALSLFNKSQEMRNKILGEKINTENGLANKEIEFNSNIAEKNNAMLYDYKSKNMERADYINKQIGKNAVDATNDLQGMERDKKLVQMNDRNNAAIEDASMMVLAGKYGEFTDRAWGEQWLNNLIASTTNPTRKAQLEGLRGKNNYHYANQPVR